MSATPLLPLLRERIRRDGPLSVAAYMAAALGDPRFGYYRSRDPLGAQGDFITAPEISQVFGELIGLWCVDLWQRLGEPGTLILAELGPGRGTLMRDALRAARLVPGFGRAAQLHLVETSPVLRAAQAAALSEAAPRWHDAIATLPDGPLLLVANEFLDALPIHQLQRTDAGWVERCVGLAPDGEALAFCRAAAPSPLAARLPAGFDAAPPGSIAELRPAAAELAGALGRRLVAQGGAALFIDYGHAPSACGDTLQALRRHRHHDPLDDPGNADLTAHVDFAAFARAAEAAGARCLGPVTQGAFLAALGIAARAETLLARASPEQAATIRSGCRRLIAGTAMGGLFKVLALTPPDGPAPAGFPQG